MSDRDPSVPEVERFEPGPRYSEAVAAGGLVFLAGQVPEDPEAGITPDDNPNNDPPLNSGFKPGLYLGGGLHVFVSDAIAIDLAVRDYAFTDNPSGADFNADLFVDDSDSRFLHHLFAGVGVSIMLPMKVKRTR